jgi:T5SS/PEP-CTERM-associated repeat protein
MVSLRICSCTCALVCLVLLAAPLSAAITPVGNVTPPLPWTASTTVRIGDGDIGGLTIDAGSMLTTQQGTLGYSQFGTGAATITGSGSEWTNTGLLHVGRDGMGFVDVQAGGKLTSSATTLGNGSQSTGLVTISGVGSQWSNYDQLNVGSSGSGTVVIEAGGQLRIADVNLGLNPGSIGTAIVTGAGSKWTKIIGISNDLIVGGSGAGSLTIEAGGQVSSDSSSLGGASDSTGIATITGAGSQWINSSELNVGRSGSGTLTIEAGGRVSNAFGYIGRNSSSTGTTTVTGAGSKWTNYSSLQIGRSGSGTLTVSDGGLVETGQLYASISDLLGNGSILATQGAVLDADLVFDTTRGSQQDLPFGSGGTLTVNWDSGILGVGHRHEGSLIVSEGAEVSTEYGYLGYRDGSTGTAVVTGAGTRWTNSISLEVGNNGSGSLTISNGGLVTAEVLAIDTDSDGDSFLNMATGGMLALAGYADDSLTQFLDLVQGTDAIRYWDASLANWAPLTAATFGEDYTLEYLATGDLAGYTLLTVGRVGDFDNDGDVDGRDFLAWQRNPELGSLADWQNAYGSDSLSATTAIPEPNCVVLLLGLMLLSGRCTTPWSFGH